MIWGIAEGAITIIAASIPILRALLRDGKQDAADMSAPTLAGSEDRIYLQPVPHHHRHGEPRSLTSTAFSRDGASPMPVTPTAPR